MRTSISEELRMIDETAREFAAGELLEDREEHDRYPFGPFFESVLVKAHEVGFFTTLLPEEMGGATDAVNALCLVLDEVCRADASLGGIIFTNALAQEIMSKAGGTETLKKNLSPGDSYEGLLVAFPSFNNPGEMENAARVVKKDGEYELDGSVEYVVLGGIAGHALLPAEGVGDEGCTFFLAELEGDGIEASEPILSLGFHACPAVDLMLSGASGRLVGEEGKGGAYFEAAIDRLSVAAASMAAGIMKSSFINALDYCKQRMQGGREIVNWSEVRMILADMAVKVKVADIIVDQVSQAVDCEEPGWQLSSRAAALHIQEMATGVTSDGIQLLGGMGYMKDYSQEKNFRDVKQIQALMGLTPMRKLNYIKRVVDGEPPW